MADQLLIFFDTFGISEQNKNNINYLRFTNCVALSEIRIVPFGSVVESRVSDTATFGTTNPASFNVKFYGLNQSSSTTLDLISNYDYDESAGVGIIKFSPPYPTNFLLIKGNYSTITLAAFGLPYMMSLQQPGIAVPNFSVPPPPLTPASAAPLMPLIPTSSSSETIASQMHPIPTSHRWPSQPPANLEQLPFLSTVPLKQEEAMKSEDSPENMGNQPAMSIEEAGDTQELAYDTVSSNEELFSECEEFDVSASKSANENDSRLEKTCWKFDPCRYSSLPEDEPPIKLTRLPNPMFSLYEVYSRLLSREDVGNADIKKEDDVFDLLLPPFPDFVQARKDAEALLQASNQFGVETNKFGSKWVLMAEKLSEILPSGLAYLSLHEKDRYDSVITCLQVWTYAGLDLDSALKQSEPGFIARHLRAGVELIGLIMSTMGEEVCAKFLSPTSTSGHLSQAMQSEGSDFPSSFHAQNVLIELLNSPFIVTSLRLLIVGALEQSLCIPLGMKSFVGWDEELTPYQRLVAFLVKNPSTPVALACEPILRRIRLYDALMDLTKIIKRIKSTSDMQVQERGEIELALQSSLTEINTCIQDVERALFAIDHEIPKINSFKHTSDPSAVLCRLLDFTGFLENITWMTESKSNALISAAIGSLTTLMRQPKGLLFLVSAPKFAGRILRSTLAEGQADFISKFGIEFAVRLEALKHIDVLCSVVRKKGETGCQAYIIDRVCMDVENGTRRDGSDPIYEALYGLSCLLLDRMNGHLYGPWVAGLLASEDYFVPLLVLLEAYDRHGATLSNKEESINAPEDEVKTQSGRKTFLARLGYSNSCLELSTLLSTVCIQVLRYADDMQYLERFGPRLLKLVQPMSWEEAISQVQSALLFSHHRHFAQAAAPWLYWLHEAPQTPDQKSIETLSYLIDQLPLLTDSLDRCLIDPPSPPRTVAAPSLPPATLLLLRLIRSHIQRADADRSIFELYTRGTGITAFIVLIECLSDFLLQLVRHPIKVSVELAHNMLDVALDILTTVVTALAEAQGEKFRDRSPLKALCKAYAASVAYADKDTYRTRSHILRCLAAYSTCREEDEINEKSLWSCVLREIFTFTVSAPVFFFPGVKLLKDLLPLPLPIASFSVPPNEERNQALVLRAWWCRHLASLPAELCGIAELFGSSPPGGPLHRTLTTFIDRVTSMGTPKVAQLLASAALDTCLEVFSKSAVGGGANTSKSDSGDPNSDQQPKENPGSSDLSSECAPDLQIPQVIQTLTMGTKLVMNAHKQIGLPRQQYLLSAASIDEQLVAATHFAAVTDPSDIMHSLCLLHFIVGHPICKQAFLDLLAEDTPQNNARSAGDTTPSKRARMISMFTSILEAQSDSRAHLTVQEKLIDCLDCLLDPTIGLKREETTPLQLANHLPPAGLLSELTDGLLAYLDYPERGVNSISLVLRILYRLASSDFGFAIIERQLSSRKRHECALTNVITRISNSLSAENPDCRAALGFFLLLVSALLGDPIFAEEARLAVDEAQVTADTQRTRHISTLKLKRILCGPENQPGSLMDDLTSRLDVLAEEQTTLRSLRDAMKSLQTLLAGVDDVLISQDDMSSPSIPTLPRRSGFEQLYARTFSNEPFFVVKELEELTRANASLDDAALLQPCETLLDAKDNRVVTKSVNLTEYAAEYCPGLTLKTNFMASSFNARKRQACEYEDSTQHQKRRRGQETSIIQTGRSAKKFVAPMRGRGFMIRQSAPAPSTGASLLGPGAGLLGTTAGGLNAPSRADIFRSRPQNTSRPPSLHVDDFNKLEKDEGTSTSGESSFGRDETAHLHNLRSLRGVDSLMTAGSLLSSSVGGGSGRVLSSLPFVGAHNPTAAAGVAGATTVGPPTSSILPTPSLVPSPINNLIASTSNTNTSVASSLLQSWAAVAAAAANASSGGRSLNLLSLTNPTRPGRLPPRPN